MKARASNGFEFDLYIQFVSYFNVIILSTVNLFKESIDLGLIRGIVLLVLALFFLVSKRIESKPHKYLLIFSSYILVMGFVTYFNYNFFPDKVIKVFLGSISFAYGLYFINSIERFIILNKVMLISIVIIIITIIVSNVLGVQYKLYADTGFSLGGQGVNIAKNLVIFIIPYPIFQITLKNTRVGRILPYLYIICLLIIVISLKRGALLGLLLGLSSYFIVSHKRGKFIRNVIVVLVIAFISFPLYSDVLQQTYSARIKNFSTEQGDIQSEGRFVEYTMTKNDIQSKDFLRTLFGEGIQSEAIYFGINRYHHTDYLSILHGAGIIGLVLYILSYYYFYKEQQKFKFMDSLYPEIREIRAVSIALIFSIIGLSFSGVYHTIDLRSTAFLYLGGCIGVLRTFYIEAGNKTVNS
jgi:hypothetical protein